MKLKIEQFLSILPDITQEESDLIKSVINWDNEMKIAFLIAKGIFEENLQ